MTTQSKAHRSASLIEEEFCSAKRKPFLMVNPDLTIGEINEELGVLIENALEKSIAMDLIFGDACNTPEEAALEGLIDSLRSDLEIMSEVHSLYLEGMWKTDESSTLVDGMEG